MQTDKIKFESPADIFDYGNEIVIVIDTKQTENLPEVEIEKNVVKIKYKRELKYEQKTHIEHHEIIVTRNITLPEDYEYKLIDMMFENGVLTLKLEKVK